MAMLRCRLLPLLALLGLATAAGAQSWDPFPSLGAGQRLAVKKSIDGSAFDAGHECLRSFDSAAGATFYGAVVEVSDAGGDPSPQSFDAEPYVDALYQDWQRRYDLDPDTHVLIVLSTANRGVAIHPGSTWADLGFANTVIGQTIDSSRFADYARDGNYGRAICTLAAAVDLKLAGLQRQEASPPNPATALERPAPSRPARASRQPRRDSGGGGLLGLLVLALLAGGGLWLFVRYRRRQRVRAAFEEELGSWRERLGHAATRILALETTHPLYFTSVRGRWEGESAGLDQRCADAVNHVFLLYTQALELRKRAEERVEGATTLAVAPYEEALALLRTTAVRFSTDEPEERLKIFLPLQREYQGTAATLLADLETAYSEAVSLLTQVETVVETADALSLRCGELASAAVAATDQRQALELPAAHLAEAFAPLLARRDEANARQAADPIAATPLHQEVESTLSGLVARAELGNRLVGSLRGPLRERGQALRADVARLREAGFRLDEPGFEPDVRLDHGVREGERIERWVAAGREEEAEELVAALEENLQELGRQLRAIEVARDEIAGALTTLEDERQRLGERIPGARHVLATLRSEHASSTFTAEADNLDELEAILTQVEEKVAHIRADHEAERYLAALADLEVCRNLVDDGFALVDAVDTIEAALREAREESQEGLDQAASAAGELAALTPAGTAGIGDRLRAEIEAASSALNALRQAAAQPTPDWLTTRHDLERLLTTLASLDGRARAEIAAHAEAAQMAAALARRLDDLGAAIRREPRDRPHVGRALSEAEAKLEAWRTHLEQPRLDGSALRQGGQEITAAIDWVQRTWRSEMEAVEAAEAQIATAHTLLTRIEAHRFGQGVVANPHTARRTLAQAEKEASSQCWEDALATARRAVEEAESERQRCHAEVEHREAAERQRLDAIRAAERRAALAHAVQGAAIHLGSGQRTPRHAAPARNRSISSSRASFGSSFKGRSRSGGSRW